MRGDGHRRAEHDGPRAHEALEALLVVLPSVSAKPPLAAVLEALLAELAAPRPRPLVALESLKKVIECNGDFIEKCALKITKMKFTSLPLNPAICCFLDFGPPFATSTYNI